MGPNNSETSGGLQLPAPQPEQAPAGTAGESAPTQPEQAGVSSAEKASGQRQVAPAMTLPTIPAATQPQPAQADDSVTTTGGLQASDETDLIEKEWVTKAKQIVEKTRDDPYKQSEELTVVKADYIKKRYNKTIKLNK